MKSKRHQKAAHKRWAGHVEKTQVSIRLSRESLSKVESYAKELGATFTGAVEAVIAAAPDSPLAE